jgi:predicted NAD/FAD-dependent oxidoreductase
MSLPSQSSPLPQHELLDVAVLGAGIAGVAAATFLARAGKKVLIFEKSRSFGGRCASRLWNNCMVDHGAQYVTFTDKSFFAQVQMATKGRLLALTKPILDVDGALLHEKNGPRYYHVEGNNRIARDLLAADQLLDCVYREHTACGLELDGSAWRVVFQEGASVRARFVVVTFPWPQTAKLLGLREDPPSFEPCLTAFFAYDGEPVGNSMEAYARFAQDGEGIAWTACENHKVGRITGGQSLFVVQASAEFSAKHLEEPPDVWTPALRISLETAWKIPAAARKQDGVFAHRWRFARKIGAPLSHPELPQGIVLAGDSFAEARVEAAWLSGITAARRVLQNTCSENESATRT